jgi:hypothetical protein
VASCAQEVNFCRKLATELGFIQPGPTPIALPEHGHFKGRSKHVHLRWYFVCDYIDTGVLRLVQTPSRDQLVDIGTKRVRSVAFARQTAPRCRFYSTATTLALLSCAVVNKSLKPSASIGPSLVLCLIHCRSPTPSAFYFAFQS